jgi:hypothetical protein
MKKTMSVFLLTVLLLGVLIFTIPVNTIGVDTSTSDPDEATGGSGSTWSRHDYLCPDGKKEKTHCLAGGNEQCTAKYCN